MCGSAIPAGVVAAHVPRLRAQAEGDDQLFQPGDPLLVVL
jgi:hypothetical protein